MTGFIAREWSCMDWTFVHEEGNKIKCVRESEKSRVFKELCIVAGRIMNVHTYNKQTAVAIITYNIIRYGLLCGEAV